MATFQLGTNLVSNPIIILIFNETKGNRGRVNDTHPSCNTPDSNVIMTAPDSIMKYSRDGAGCKIWPENCYSTHPTPPPHFSSFLYFSNKQHVDFSKRRSRSDIFLSGPPEAERNNKNAVFKSCKGASKLPVYQYLHTLSSHWSSCC